jgi:hypothetical protein
MMAKIYLVMGLFLSLANSSSIAFDPINGGPASSLSSTVLFLTNTTRDKIDFPEASLEEVLMFLQRTGDVDPKFGVRIDYSRVKNPREIRVKLVETSISPLQAVSVLAEQTGATLQIEPGKLILIPKGN